jgi:hypothetical protein
MSAARTFLFFFAVQALNYALLCWNYRAVAQARLGNVFVSDLACAAISFTLIKRVAKAESRAAMAGYVLGGAVGSVVSVYATKGFFGS